MGWLSDLLHSALDMTIHPTELNVGEDAQVQGYHSGYEDGFVAGNHGFGHEQFGNDLGHDNSGGGFSSMGDTGSFG